MRESPLGEFCLQIRKNIEDDLGGSDVVIESQSLLLDMITSKLFIIGLMNDHALTKGIMNGDDLIPCFKTTFLPYTNSLRLDIMALNELSRHTTHKASVDLNEYVSRKYGAAKDEKQKD